MKLNKLIKSFLLLAVMLCCFSMKAQDVNVWVIGNVGDQGWDPSVGTQMTYNESDGTYELTADFKANSYFSFTTALASTSSGWGEIRPYRFGAPTNNYAITDDFLGVVIECGAYGTSADNAFIIKKAAQYKITIYLSNSGGNNSVLFERLENPEQLITDGVLYYRIDPETHTAIVVFDDSYIQFTDLVIPVTIEVDGEQYTVTGIADGAFSGCNLRSVSIYANITEGNGGFNNCTVETLYVADNVTTMLGLGINPSAIYCFSLTPPVCDDNTFSSYNAAFHVPLQVMTDYFLADVWYNFNNINSDAGEQPKSLSLEQENATISIGATLQLNATVTPAGMVPIYWQSTNTAVAEVTDYGLITAHAVGETDIIVTCMGLKRTCHVIVPIVATINRHYLYLKRGDIAHLNATTTPTTSTVTWYSTDTDVAVVRVVNGEAMVLGNRPGKAFIIASSEGELVQPDTCLVTVIRPKGDANNDGLVDVTDVNEMVNIILGKVEDFEINPYVDTNDDNKIDVTDVNNIVNVILGKMDLYMPEVVTYTVNGVSFEMVAVDGGIFTMGATPEQGSDVFENEQPAHQVNLSSYSIGQTEVTQELWVAVMDSNPSYCDGDLQRPVEKVSWDDCQTFITKLNQITGQYFRLPTEAEWEYAARGGNRSQGYKYAGSNDIEEVAWYYSNSGTPIQASHPVATKAPNELGLYDMSGNVWEWCQDWYDSYNSDAQTDPTGPASGSYRVVCGGSWFDEAKGCRVSSRTTGTPEVIYMNVGFRLAL